MKTKSATSLTSASAKVPATLTRLALALCFSTVALMSNAAVNQSNVTIERTPKIQYPKAMLDAKLEGDVEILCTIDESGQVVKPTVRRSAHASLEPIALQALLGMQFKPAMRDGKPMSREIVLPFSFRMPVSGNAPYSVSVMPDVAAAALKSDKLAAVKVAAPVVYPRDLLLQRVTGSASVVAYVDETGKVQRVTVDKASHPEFGEATKAMMYNWTFYPQQKDGKAIAGQVSYEQEFKRDALATQYTPRTRELVFALEDTKSEAVDADKLDNTLKARFQPVPVDPVFAAAAGETRAPETVMVEFFVDPEGFVQLPKVISASNQERGWAAASAAKRWVYDAPQVNGKPVFALKQVAIEFK